MTLYVMKTSEKGGAQMEYAIGRNMIELAKKFNSLTDSNLHESLEAGTFYVEDQFGKEVQSGK